jgi:hypothetical protein
MTRWLTGTPSPPAWGELRRGLPDPGDVFATVQRVIDATLAVFQVDGASLALEHEDGSLRWVVVTDDAAELLEDTQRDLGRDPAWLRMPRRRPWRSSTWTPTDGSNGWPRS